MRQHQIPLYALESRDPVKDFDLIAFSIGYEMSYTNILNMLNLAGVPLLSRDRPGLQGLVFAGGVMSSSVIAQYVKEQFPRAHFVPGRFSSDNAIGVSILAARSLT